jgi:nicotinate-nucleotide pyrophosphorylase (carboxylating)
MSTIDSHSVKLTLHPQILAVIRRALDEDIGPGDATSNRIIPADALMEGRIIAKQNGVIAGMDVAAAVYTTFDPRVDFRPEVEEGAGVENRQTVAVVTGPARSLLTAERTALNFLGRMSGIATLTGQFVQAVAGTEAIILDTRKTAPGLRMLDKLAVRRGGGQNHRSGLYDMILIKDNHVDFAGSITDSVKQARIGAGRLQLEVEARTLEHVREALDLGVERIMLDNMPPEMMAEAVRLSGGKAQLEASGNVSLENVRRIAETGVHFISVGALTHSAKVLDLSFEYVRTGAIDSPVRAIGESSPQAGELPSNEEPENER